MGMYFVSSNNGLPLLVRTSDGPKAVSCVYDPIFQSDWVLYADAYTDKLTVRYGQLDFRESPQKIEISFGESKQVEDATFPVTLNEDYERTRLITMDMPETEGGAATTFGVSSDDNFHGFLISGNGIMDFQALRRNGYDAGQIPVERYKFREYFCSPVYLYHNNDVSFTKNKTLFIGQSTSEGSIHSIGISPTNVKIHYIDDWQTISNSVFDIHQVGDGEMVIIYSVKTTPFTIDGNRYNDYIEDPDSEWSPSNSVYMLSTVDDGASWSAPTSKNLEDSGSYHKPLMILNAVKYIHSVYNSLSGTFHIFCLHYDEDVRPYLGVFNVSLFKLLNNTKECTGIIEEGYSFLWRPPLLDVEWTSSSNQISTSEPVGNAATELYKDSFTRIIGRTETESNIDEENDLSLSNLTGSVTGNGVVRLLYDDGSGNIKVLFSTSFGFQWSRSEIIVARNSTSALCIDSNLFYISPIGIVVKLLDPIYWQKVYSAIEGSSAEIIEEVQREFDSAESIDIGTGQIDSQRLSGYRTSRDVYYIFYYDNNGALSAVRGDGRNDWSAAANF